MNGSKGSRQVPIRVSPQQIVPPPTNQQPQRLRWKLECLEIPGWRLSVRVVPKATHWRRDEKDPRVTVRFWWFLSATGTMGDGA
jgi:hypothetical protein